MNDKSRNICTACAASTPANLSNNKFLKDYYKFVKHHLSENYLPKNVTRFPAVDELKEFAEKKFFEFYNLEPTCAVYAPGTLSIAGKCMGVAESKSLSMAIQLVTLIVGKYYQYKRCRIVSFLDKTKVEKVEIGLKENELYIADKEKLWIRYLKGALRTFKEKYSYIPGFQMVIVTNLPSHYDLGKNAALIVALYMFLETVSHTYTVNIIEKALMCHSAEKLAIRSPYKARISDVLISVLGKEDKIFVTDAYSLHFDQYDWNNIDAELILIELKIERNKSSEWHINKTQYREIMTVINTQSRWRTHPIGMSMLKYLFPEKTIKMIYDAIDKDKRITKIGYAIRDEQWEKLGELLWENHRSVCKYLTFLSDDIKNIESTFRIIEGVLGASVINYGTAIITLVQKSKLKTFLYHLNRTQIPYQKCYLIKACSGATVIYGYEKRITSFLGKKYISRQQIKKYHLVINEYDNYDYEFTSKYEPRYSASLNLPHLSFV